MEKAIARLISVVFHPLMLTTFGFYLLFRTDIYFPQYAPSTVRIILLITFVATCLLPSLFIIAGLILFKDVRSWKKISPLTVVYLFSGVCYYVAFMISSHLTIASFYKSLFLVGSLQLCVMALISTQWNISSHMSAAGSIFGVILAVMLRYGILHLNLLSVVLLVAGFLGYSRLVLAKNNPAQVYAGFGIGSLMTFLIFNFM